MKLQVQIHFRYWKYSTVDIIVLPTSFCNRKSFLIIIAGFFLKYLRRNWGIATKLSLKTEAFCKSNRLLTHLPRDLTG